MAFACHFHVLDDCLQKIMIGITYKYTLVFTFAFDNVVAPHRWDLKLMGFQIFSRKNIIQVSSK